MDEGATASCSDRRESSPFSLPLGLERSSGAVIDFFGNVRRVTIH